MSSRYQHLPISRALTLIFVFVSLLSVAVIFFLLQYLKEYTVEELAENEATKTAELIFQNLYTGMQKGWSKDDINSIISNISETITDTNITLYRSEAVESLFGKPVDQHHPESRDEAVKQVFESRKPLLLSNHEQLRYIYPLIAEQKCLSCHTNSKPGQVNGIVSIALPLEKLRVPFEFTINSVIYIFIVSVLLLGLIVYFAVRRLMVRPVESMCEYMSDVSNSRDISQRLPVDKSSFKEIRGLYDMFNRLLGVLKKPRMIYVNVQRSIC